MNTDSNNQDQWNPCDQGEIGKLVQHLKDRRRTQVLQRNATVALLLMMVGFSGYFVFSGGGLGDAGHGGIVCTDVMRQADEFIANSLDAQTNDNIREHIVHCDACRIQIEKMRAELNEPAATELQSEQEADIATRFDMTSHTLVGSGVFSSIEF